MRHIVLSNNYTLTIRMKCLDITHRLDTFFDTSSLYVVQVKLKHQI